MLPPLPFEMARLLPDPEVVRWLALVAARRSPGEGQPTPTVPLSLPTPPTPPDRSSMNEDERIAELLKALALRWRAEAAERGAEDTILTAGAADMVLAAVVADPAATMRSTSEQTEERATIERALEMWEQKGPTSLTVALVTDALYGARDRLATVEGYLRELRDAADMPMHHQADIDQFLVEVLGVTDPADPNHVIEFLSGDAVVSVNGGPAQAVRAGDTLTIPSGIQVTST